MSPRSLVPLLLLPLLVVGGATTIASGRLELGAMAGLVSALISALVAVLAHRAQESQTDALIAAARVVNAQLNGPNVDQQDLTQLARGVNALAERARDVSRNFDTLTAVLDGMAEGIWITDSRGVIIRHNSALKELLLAGQELIGQAPISVVRNQALADAVARACELATSSRLEISLEAVRPRKLAIHVIPLREVGGSAAVFHDLTELRRLEEVRTDFVANVSHELRTPITAIRGYAETLTSGALSDPENAKKMVSIIHRQSERLSELVEDLLELSRLEARDIELARKPLELAEVVARAAEAVRPQATSKKVELRINVPEDLVIWADERALEQVLLNLLDNGVKFTPAGGWVELRAWEEGRRCQVAVRDTGLGMDAKHLPRIFERFYRVDKGRSRDMGGTGLGLSIVKHLVTAMDGEVRVESQAGSGSTFFLSLPCPPVHPDDRQVPRAR